MAYLPQDLIRDILSRLPVKSLLRFKCVHKSWNSLFKSSTFITTHFQNPNNKEHGLGCGFVLVDLLEYCEGKFSYNYKFLRRDTFDAYFDVTVLPHQFVHGNYYFAGSCNGLVCICLRGTFLNDTNFVLFNFSLKQHKIIPQSNLHPIDYFCFFVASGFGYDSKNNDYKVVRIARWHACRTNNEFLKAEVYTLGLNSWREVELPDVDFKSINEVNSYAYLNGANHWLGYKNKRNCVICFDVSSEVFQLFPLPVYLAEESLNNTSVDVYGDLLSLVKRVRRGNDTFYDIWVMREYGVEESWIKLRSICSSSDDKDLYFIGFGLNTELLLGHYKRLIVLCPNKKEPKDIEFDQPVCRLNVVHYMESLVSLEEDNE